MKNFDYWNYRIIKKSKEDLYFYEIHEVYYNENNEIISWTETPVLPFGESLSELRNDVFYFMSAFKYPYLIEIFDNSKVKLIEDPDEKITGLLYNFYSKLSKKILIYKANL